MLSITLMLLFFILANLPWINERFLLVFVLKEGKPIVTRLLELVMLYFASLLIAMVVEVRFSGAVFTQQWEFFVVTFCLFVLLSVPGIVYRFQWLVIDK